MRRPPSVRPLARAARVALAVAALSPCRLAAQSPFRGEYALYARGSEVVVIRFDDAAGGGVRGTVTMLGDARPFAATPAGGGALEFPLEAPDGTATRWRLVAQGERLAVTVSGAGASERQLFERRGGWSDDTPLARQWRARLEGRAVTRTTTTDGGTAGGASTDATMSFCPGGVLAGETRSVVSVYVPGAPGSRTSREASRGRWRVVSRGDVAALIVADEGSTLQLGVRADGDVLYLAEQPMRLQRGECP